MCRLPLYCTPLLAFLLLAPTGAMAARVESLYRAEAEVVDKGSEAREEGFRTALERVIVKVTGRVEVLSDSSLQPALQQPQRYVQQYRYEPLEIDPDATVEGESTGDGDGEEEPVPKYRLEVVFAKRQIDNILSEREIPVWDVYRPQVLVWLAFDDGRRRTLVAADHVGDIGEALRKGAQRRGVPLLLPLLDTEDQRRIEYLDIQGGFLDRVREASARYQAGLVLTAHVYRDGNDWRGDWTLLEADERRGWLTRADNAAEVVRSGIDGLAERLAARLAGQKDELRQVRVRVSRATELADYARLSRYFRELPRIDQQRVVRVRPDEILFELSLRGQLSDLERAIALDDLLEPDRPAGGEPVAPGIDVLTGGETSIADTAVNVDGPSGGPVSEVGRQPDTDGETPVREADLIYRLAG